MKKIRITKIKNLIDIVLRTNAFYKHLYKKYGIFSGNQIQTWQNFESLPFTSKRDFVLDQIRHPLFGTNVTYNRSRYTFILETSGTTGKRFTVPVTNEGFRHMVKVEEYIHRKVFGINKNDVYLYIGPSIWFTIYSQALRNIGATVIPPEWDALVLLNTIQIMKVTVMHIYPTFLYLLTEIVEERNISIKKLGVKKIITKGEPGGNNPSVRKMFENKWGAKIYDEVASTEAVTEAVSCSKGMYHALDNFSLIEIIDENNKPAKKGELVITPFWKYDYPFIRYKTGNIVELDEKSCHCGWKSMMLKNGFLGRIDNQIKLRAYSLQQEDIEYSLREFTKIIEYRIVCYKNHGLDMVDIFLELPLNTTYQYAMSISQKLTATIMFKPQLHLLFPKTLGRFGMQKGKRIIDVRVTNTDNSQNNNRFLNSIVGWKALALSTLFMQVLIFNERKSKLLKVLGRLK